MDAKTRLINKIADRVNIEKNIAHEKERAVEAFRTDWLELAYGIKSLASDIPELKLQGIPGVVDGILFELKTVSLTLFGHEIIVEAEKGDKQFGIQVTNIWNQPTFLVPVRVGHWASANKDGDRLELTLEKIIDRLSELADEPAAKKAVTLWE